MNKPFGVVAAMVLAFFAGCVGDAESSGEQPNATGPQVNTGPAEFDETTGAIEGSVTSADVEPIAGAQVGLLPTEQLPTPPNALTDETGRFALSRVPPGSYQIGAVAAGYEAQTKGVDVVVGQVVAVSFLMVPLPTTDPYHRTIQESLQLSSIMYKVTPECLYFAQYIPPGVPVVSENANLVKTCGGVRFGNTTVPGTNTPVTRNCSACETHTETNKKYSEFNEFWETIVGEATWQAQTGLTGKGFSFDINAPNVTRGTGGSIDQASKYTWYKATGKSPIVIRIDKNVTLPERQIPEADWNNYEDSKGCTAPTSGTNLNCDWFWRMFAAACDLGICNDGFGPDYGIMYEGKVDVYFSYFVREVAPQDFSALPDA